MATIEHRWLEVFESAAGLVSASVLSTFVDFAAEGLEVADSELSPWRGGFELDLDFTISKNLDDPHSE